MVAKAFSEKDATEKKSSITESSERNHGTLIPYYEIFLFNF